MRSDMHHVIIDRPRTGGDGGKSILPKGKKKLFQKTPWEDQVKFESTARKRVYGYDCKQLNEHLTPLQRWLHSQVGRNWDKVWSEICDGLSVRNATTAHVRDHVDQYVEKNCYIDEDGEIVNSKGGYLYEGWRVYQFFVDPRNDTLQVAPKRKRNYRKKEKIWVGIDNKFYYLLKDIWYEVFFEEFSETHVYLKKWDSVISVLWNEKKQYTGSYRNECVLFHGRSVFASSKKQLSKKEIKKLGLK